VCTTAAAPTRVTRRDRSRKPIRRRPTLEPGSCDVARETDEVMQHDDIDENGFL
jgi:hypothetical protein